MKRKTAKRGDIMQQEMNYNNDPDVLKKFGRIINEEVEKGKIDPVIGRDEEIRNMGFEKMPVNIDYEVGDTVKIVTGPLESFIGIVEEINMEKEKVRVLVSMFGRETPVELEFSQIQKM